MFQRNPQDNQAFSVTFINEARGIHKTIRIKSHEIMLDAANQEGLDLPYACYTGSCTTCTAKVLAGKVDQTEQADRFLGHLLTQTGYILPCAACPRSDCTILTHQEEEIF